MEYEVIGNSVMVVERVPRRDGRQPDHIVRRFHDLYLHARIEVPQNVEAGAPISIPVSLVKWDDGTLVVDRDQPLTLVVNDIVAAELTTENGTGEFEVQFMDAGTYRLVVTGELVKQAEAEVIVR